MFAAVVVIITRLLTKKWAVGLLVGYILIILGETVLFRRPSSWQHYRLELFWSYQNWDILKEQIVLNIVVFIPIGLITGSLWKWKGLFVGIVLSTTIELFQLLSSRGLFEFDPGEILGTTRLSPYKSRVSGL